VGAGWGAVWHSIARRYKGSFSGTILCPLALLSGLHQQPVGSINHDLDAVVVRGSFWQLKPPIGGDG
jgi:hypothetical protein